MAKRTQKSTRKREPPWLSAAREKLRAKAPEDARDRAYEEAVVDALLEMASPEVLELPADASDEDLDRTIYWAVFAYNQPILESIPADERNNPAQVLVEAIDLAFEQFPGLRQRYHRMLAVREQRFGHLTWLIRQAKASWGDEGDVRIEITLLRLEPKKRLATGE